MDSSDVKDKFILVYREGYLLFMELLALIYCRDQVLSCFHSN